MANEISIALGSFALDSTNGISISKINHQIQKQVQSFEIPKGDLSVIPIAKRGSIVVQISGALTSSNYDALRTAIQSLRNAIESSSEQQFIMDDDYYLLGQYRSFSHEVTTMRTFMKFSFELVCSYPFWQSVTLTQSTPAWTTGVGFTINNPGTAPCRVKCKLTAPGSSIANDAQLENQTTGELWKFAGTIAATKILLVDNRVAQNELLVTNDAVNAINSWSGDFINLAPGNNTLVLTCGRSTAVLDLYYRKTMR